MKKLSKERRDALRKEDEEIDLIARAVRFEEIYICNAATLLEDARDETPFLAEQAIPEEAICFMAGRPGSMKSWVAYDLALAVARGRPWLSFDVPNSGKVLVLNYDNPSYEIARRFKRLGMTADDQIYFHSIGKSLPPEGLPGVLRIPDAMPPLNMIVSRIRPDLIIVDSFRQSHTGEERSSSDMSRVMACLHQLRGLGAAVLAIHHLRKGQKGKGGVEEKDDEPMRGSTEIEASADVIMLMKDGILELNKTRGFIPESNECDYEVIDEGDKTIVRSTRQLEVFLTALQDKGLTRSELRTVLKVNRRAVDQLIRRALTSGTVVEKRITGEKGKIDRREIQLVKKGN